VSNIDPDTLLGDIRNAFVLGHPSMAALAFATLDDQLSHGGKWPTDWLDPVRHRTKNLNRHERMG
jgi:hypothetical protein